MQIKDYLESENARNREHAALFERIVKMAFGQDAAVLVGHHIGFEFAGDINTENEIPSADTMMFCHDLMKRIFGDAHLSIMSDLAKTPSEHRDARLKEILDDFEQPLQGMISEGVIAS